MNKILKSCVVSGLVCGSLVFGFSDTALASEAASGTDGVTAIMEAGAPDAQHASHWTRFRDELLGRPHRPPPPPRHIHRPPPPPRRQPPPPPPPRRQPPPPGHRPGGPGHGGPPPHRRAVMHEVPQPGIVMNDGMTNIR